MNFQEFQKEQLPRLENKLEEIIPPSPLFAAAQYALKTGGKRLRPLLTLAVAKTVKAPLEIALTPAAAIELIHTYSLIHDDLPAMDNDDFRRGKPTLHKVFGEGHAILTGDYLLTHAFHLLASDWLIPPLQKLDIIQLFSTYASSPGMIGGQALDLSNENRPITLNELTEINHQKTGALFIAATLSGAILGNVSTEEKSLFKQFALHFGEAFQILDDYLDTCDPNKMRGKTNGSDVTNQRTTFLTLLGKEHALQEAENLLKKALHSLHQLPYDTSLLTDLLNYIFNCYHITLTEVK